MTNIIKNHGARWSKEQDDYLITSLKTMEIPDIAKKMERTDSSIRLHLASITCKIIEKEKLSIEDALAITKISREILDSYL